MSDYKAQLLVVEARLAKEPDDEELLSLKQDLLELIELSGELEEEKPSDQSSTCRKDRTSDTQVASSSHSSGDSQSGNQGHNDNNSLVDKRRTLSEAELLLKKKEKNRKKKAKLREKHKEQLDIAESEKQNWLAFVNKKGLKGKSKKSIFASPCSVTGKVGVGTNGIADAPSAAMGASSLTKRRY